MTEQQQNTEQQTTSDESQNTEQRQDAAQVYRTQEDFDKAFARKLEKERQKIRDEINQQAEDERKKAQMDATQKAEAEKAEAEKRASERESAALERVVKAEAKLTAHGLGVKPERVAAVIRLSDLSEVEVTDGEPDADALKSAIEATLADYPEFKAASQSVGGSGSKVAGGDPLEKNPWSKEHFNLTEQGRIMEADPVKALRLQQAAG